MNVYVIKKEDGFWLVLDGKLKAAIHLGTHGEIVTAALEEASQCTESNDTKKDVP